MSGAIQPASNDPVADIRLIREQVRNDCRLLEQRINEHDNDCKRVLEGVNETRDFVDKRSHVFGVGLALGITAGVLVLLFLLYNSLEPIVKVIAERGVESRAASIDWDKEISTATDAALEKRLTNEVVEKAVDNDAIRKAVSSVVNSPEFKTIIREQAEKAARDSVTSVVEQIVADTNHFSAVVENALRTYRDRLEAAAATYTTVKANNRQELSDNVYKAILGYERLVQEYTHVNVLPLKDALRVHSLIVSFPQEPADQRFRLFHFEFDDLTASQNEPREKVGTYLGLRTVPKTVGMCHSEGTTGKSFKPGEYSNADYSRFPDYPTIAKAATEDTITLVEECFQIEYPVTWRVQVSN